MCSFWQAVEFLPCCDKTFPNFFKFVLFELIMIFESTSADYATLFVQIVDCQLVSDAQMRPMLGTFCPMLNSVLSDHSSLLEYLHRNLPEPFRILPKCFLMCFHEFTSTLRSFILPSLRAPLNQHCCKRWFCTRCSTHMRGDICSP